MAEKEDKDEEDLQIPVQPNNILLFVYQSEWQKLLLDSFFKIKESLNYIKL